MFPAAPPGRGAQHLCICVLLSLSTSLKGQVRGEMETPEPGIMRGKFPYST